MVLVHILQCDVRRGFGGEVVICLVGRVRAGPRVVQRIIDLGNDRSLAVVVMALDNLSAEAIATRNLAVDDDGPRFWLGHGFAVERWVLKTEAAGRIAPRPEVPVADA